MKHLLIGFLLAWPLTSQAIFEDCKYHFPNQITPTTSEVGKDLCFEAFAIYYSPNTKKPIYTVEKLNRELLTSNHPKRTNHFYEEARLPFAQRSLLSDYKGSGYDRGHNVPAADMVTENSMAQSFSLANMMPQAKENNRGIWAKSVEKPTRQYILRASGNVFVFTGSTGNIGTIGKNHVVVPSYLFKLVFDETKNKSWAYWVVNSDNAQISAPITYQELVRRTGIDFKLNPN